MFGNEAGVHARELDEAANQQAGAGQQHDGERHFGDDESGAQAVAAPASAAAVTAFAQRLRQTAACRLERRKDPERQTREQRRWPA